MHGLARTLHKKYVKKYGENFMGRIETKDEVVYGWHYMFCIFLMVGLPFWKDPMLVFFVFAIEMMMMLFLMQILDPHYWVVKVLFLPSLGMILYCIIFGIINWLKIGVEVYAIAWITIILNFVINSVIMWKVRIQNKSRVLKITVKRKESIKIDYDCSVLFYSENRKGDGDSFILFFLDDSGKEYVFQTDLDEKFIEGQVYEVCLKNKNISSKIITIYGEDVYVIEKKVDANRFVLKNG